MSQPVPAWVSFDAVKTVGLDLLGLRAPIQQISNELFNGVTTITPKLRYLSVISRNERRRTPRRTEPCINKISRRKTELE